MKKLLILVLALVLGAGGFYFWSKTRAPKEFTAQDMLVWFFEQEYPGYSEGTIEFTDSARAGSGTVKFQADSKAQYYNGTTTFGADSTTLKEWQSTVNKGEVVSYVNTEGGSWEKEIILSPAEEIEATVELTDIFYNMVFAEDDASYTVSGSMLLPQGFEYFKLPIKKINGVLLQEMFAEKKEAIFQLVIDRASDKPVSFLVQSLNNETSLKIRFDKLGESLTLTLPTDLEKQESVEKVQHEFTSLPGNILEYEPAATPLSKDWTNMEFCFDGLTHKLGERLDAMLVNGWEIKNEGLEISTPIVQSETVEKILLENLNFPSVSVVVSAKNESAGIEILSNCSITEIVVTKDATLSSLLGGTSPVKVSGGGGIGSTADDIKTLYGTPDYTLNFNAEDNFVYEYHSGTLQLKFTFNYGKVSAIRLREI